MENRSFEKDPKDNPPGPSKPRTDLPGERKDQANENKPPLARISDDEDNESPPAYIQRYMPKKPKIPDDLDDLEPPPTDPVQQPHDDRLQPELVATARKREERRHIQKVTPGLCSLRPNSPNLPPLPPPQPYPDPDNGQQVVNADNPEEHQEQGAIAGQQGAIAGQQGAIAGQQGAIAPDVDQQADNATVRSATWMESCFSCYETMTTFNFQFPFHTLLLTWPIATGVMGALNSGKKYCRMNDWLHWVMIAIAVFGTIAILTRLFAIYYEKVFPNQRIRIWWIVVRVLEIVTWAFFGTQLYFFFKQAASFNPEDANYCKPRIYRINCGLIFLQSTILFVWIAVNVEKLIYWFLRRNEPANN